MRLLLMMMMMMMMMIQLFRLEFPRGGPTLLNKDILMTQTR